MWRLTSAPGAGNDVSEDEMSEEMYTALPWNVSENRNRLIMREEPGIADGNESYTVAETKFHSLISPEEAAANAKLIVRSVNALPALVKALERLKGQVERLKKENLDQYRALLIRDEDVAELKDEIERLKAERDENFQEYVDTNEARIDAEARAEAAEKEVEQLQALQIEKTSDDDLGELDFQVAQEWARRGKQDDR